MGGFMYGIFGITASYAADVLLTIAGLVLILNVASRPLPPESEEQGVFDKIKAGLRFVFTNKIVLAAISLDLFAVLFGGAVALLPILPTRYFTSGHSVSAYFVLLPPWGLY